MYYEILFEGKCMLFLFITFIKKKNYILHIINETIFDIFNIFSIFHLISLPCQFVQIFYTNL